MCGPCPPDPPEAMAQGTHGMDAMDTTCHGVVEGDAHLFEYDLDDPGEVHAMTARVARCDDCGNWFPVPAATG
jgi:hypothetical protein